MHANYSPQTIQIDSSATGTFIDKLHGDPFKDLTIWMRSLDTTITFSYIVNYGSNQQATGTVLAGKVGTFNDASIQPPNQPNSNWSLMTDPNQTGINTVVVGVPISVVITNTGAKSAVFVVSFVSETYGQIVG